MPQRGEILVVIDPTADEQPAAARAARLAKALGAPLELFICDYEQSIASRSPLDREGLERARRNILDDRVAALEALAAPLRAEGLTVSVDARWARPLHRGIVAKIADAAPALVVKDTHHHDVLRRTLLSNTDWNLIRSCPVPLLLVKPREIGLTPKILAAVDPMHEHDKPAELDRAILSFADRLTRAIGGELHVLHSFDLAPVFAAAADSPLSMTTVPTAEMTAEIERRHRDALRELAAAHGIDPARTHLEQGAAHHAIARVAADLGADFVVMGAVSRSGLEKVFLGSTAERALDRVPCDLIVVKPPGFAPPD